MTVQPGYSVNASGLFTAQHRGLEWLAAQGFTPVMVPLVYPANGEESVGFRFVDWAGNLWAVRSDFTPLVSQLVVRQSDQESCLRVCYAGEVARPAGARLRGVAELCQLGFESFLGGDHAATALRVLLGLLRHLGLDPSDLVVTVTHAELGREILTQLLEEPPDAELLQLMVAKDVDALVEQIGVRGEGERYLRQAILGEGEGWVRFFAGQQRWEQLRGAADEVWAAGATAQLEAALPAVGRYYHGVIFSVWGRRRRVLVASGGEYQVPARDRSLPGVGATVAVEQVVLEAQC
ncbi:MAG: ATP phosphoribosyltransferase regulatory subunit [Thermoanaerobaculum sp.]|nr:ATP phosphoribosyltransferase regulatory subunit [Thermoanaerobaculum sp.]